MSDMSESLFQAIDTIVSKRLQAINFDNTNIYSITDASKADVGEYKVTDGSVTFTAYSTSTSYKENDVVYVTIPNNDFNQQKLIIGKYIAESETPFIFRNPTSTMIDVTGNIISGEIPEGILLANARNDGTNTEHKPYPYNSQSEENEEEVIMWEKDFRSQNYIGFERLGLKADFKSWLGELGCVQGHYGLKIRIFCLKNGTYSTTTHYELIRDKLNKGSVSEINKILTTSGIREEMGNTNADKDAVLDYIDEKIAELYATYDLYLDSDDMIGNPYDFVTYHQQEQVFDITDRGQIIGIRLSFYQQPTTFKDAGGVEIAHTDRFGFLLSKNLFAIDPYIMLGYDLDGFNGEQVMLTTTDSLTYKQSDSDDAVANGDTDYNKKIIHLSWLHKDKSNEIVHILDDAAIDGSYEIRWYQWSAGAGSPDEWAGVEWKEITPIGTNNQRKPHEFVYTFEITEDSHNKEHELIKAIVLFTSSTGVTTPIHSNTIEFRNEKTVLSDAIIDQSRGLSFKFLDDTNGCYYIYRQNYKLIDENQGRVNRKLQCELYSEELKTNGDLQYAKSITWRIPATNTMIYLENFDYSAIGAKFTKDEILAKYGVSSENQLSDEQKTEIGASKEPVYYDNISYEKHKDDEISELTPYLDAFGNSASVGNYTILLYDIENKEIVITWYGNEDNGYSINSILEYRIEDYYSQNNTNNTITCIVTKDNRDYVGKAELYFGVGGTNGTNYTLIIEAYNENEESGQEQRDSALVANVTNSTKFFRAELYTVTPKSSRVDIYNNENFSKLKFEWKLGNSKETTCHTESSSAYNFVPLSGGDTGTSNNYNLKINDIFYVNPNPNVIKLSYNANINDLLYLELTVKGWGDYNLYTVFPIPIRVNNINLTEAEQGFTYKISHINGPREVCYLPDGYPEYMNNPYSLYVAKFKDGLLADNDIQVNNVAWTIYNPFDRLERILHYTEEQKAALMVKCENAFNDDDTYTSAGNDVYDNVYCRIFTQFEQDWDIVSVYDEEGRFLGFDWNATRHKRIDRVKQILKQKYYLGDLTENYSLQPLNFYISNEMGYGVQATYKNAVVWTQPIWIYQNDYGSTTLNKWDGKSIQIDEENGTIVTRALAAGKKEYDNSFTGVVIGDWSAAGGGDSSSALTIHTGVYGFEHGAMAYAFKDDGTAFIGKSGKGRILFDGNESTITSENYNSGRGGVLLDLDNGFQSFRNTNAQYVPVFFDYKDDFETIKNDLFLPNVQKINNNATYNKNLYYYIKENETDAYAIPVEINSVNDFNNLKNKLYVESGTYIRLSNDFVFNSSLRYYYYSTEFNINLNAQDNNLSWGDRALEIGANSPNFWVTWDGTMHCRNADVQGSVTGSTININNQAFYVDSDGKTGIIDAEIYNLRAHYLSVIERLGTTGTSIDVYSELNNLGGINGGNINSPNIYGGTLYNPTIHIYLGTTQGSTSTSYQYTVANNYNANTYYYYKFVGSDEYQPEGFITRAQFDERDGFVGLWYTRKKVSTTSWTNTGSQSPIYIHSGSYSSGPEVGKIGDTGYTTDSNGTAGFFMTGGNYGVALKAHGGAILTVGGGSDGNIFMATSNGKGKLQITNTDETVDGNPTVVTLANGKWSVYLANEPYVVGGGKNYDLRYAYFA